MDLFLDNTWESRLVEHFVLYTNLSRSVNVVRLSGNALAHVQKKTISLQVPSLVANSEDYLTSPVSICVHLATISGTKGFLFGNDYKQETQNISYIELVKANNDLIKNLNEELATKTYLVDSHVSFADLAVFFGVYQQVTTMTDEEKWENCNLFRWFNHIQNLPGVGEYLLANRMPKATFPVTKPKPVLEKKVKKEKKIGTQAPPKDDKKPKQQQQQQQQQEKPNKRELKKQQKAEEKKKQPQQKKGPATVDCVPTDAQYFNQFIDIRVGELKKVWKHPDSDKLWCEEIDVGEPELRQIASGLQQIIPLEGMTGKVCVMTNLKPRPLAGFKSNGMVMCATSSDKSVTQILRPPADAKVGDRIVLEGANIEFQQEPLGIPNSKKKVLENAFPLLKSDNGCATYSGFKFTVGGGNCTTEVKEGTVA